MGTSADSQLRLERTPFLSNILFNKPLAGMGELIRREKLDRRSAVSRPAEHHQFGFTFRVADNRYPGDIAAVLVEKSQVTPISAAFIALKTLHNDQQLDAGVRGAVEKTRIFPAIVTVLCRLNKNLFSVQCCVFYLQSCLQSL